MPIWRGTVYRDKSCRLPGRAQEPIWRFHRRPNSQGQSFLLRRLPGCAAEVRVLRYRHRSIIAGTAECTGATSASNGTAGCDFSQYLAVPGHQLYDNSTGTSIPYHNNIIPLTQLSPQALNLFKLLLANGKVPNTFTTTTAYRATIRALERAFSTAINGTFAVTQRWVRELTCSAASAASPTL